jgi:hypothetical protein
LAGVSDARVSAAIRNFVNTYLELKGTADFEWAVLFKFSDLTEGTTMTVEEFYALGPVVERYRAAIDEEKIRGFDEPVDKVEDDVCIVDQTEQVEAPVPESKITLSSDAKEPAPEPSSSPPPRNPAHTLDRDSKILICVLDLIKGVVPKQIEGISRILADNPYIIRDLNRIY